MAGPERCQAGKLTEAGRQWARGDNTAPDYRAQAVRNAAAMGLSLALDAPQEALGLWEDHIAAWQAWCAVSGQWRVTGLSGMSAAKLIWHGLDYAAARAGLELAGIAADPGLWAEVRMIEAGAAEELNRAG